MCLQEFEVIAQIKLLQLASNNYSFTPDSHFREWFTGVEKLSEAERSVNDKVRKLEVDKVLFFVIFLCDAKHYRACCHPADMNSE